MLLTYSAAAVFLIGLASVAVVPSIADNASDVRSEGVVVVPPGGDESQAGELEPIGRDQVELIIEALQRSVHAGELPRKPPWGDSWEAVYEHLREQQKWPGRGAPQLILLELVPAESEQRQGL
jgi:hypothetical protein